MQRSLLSFRLVFFSCLILPTVLNAQKGVQGNRSNPGGIIEVHVRYDNGQPGPRGIHVRLESAEGGAAGDCETREGGKCEFRPAQKGVYIVRMNERAYKEVNIRIELTGNTMGYATIELKPVGGEPIAERAAKPVGDSVSVVDASVPANAREEYDKAQSALVDNKTEAAIGHLQKAVKLYKPFPSAYTLLGRAYLTQKNWTEAEAALHKAIGLDADSAEAYLALGAVYNQTKNYPGAETALVQGLKLKPDAPGGEYELAKTYWSLGRWQESAPYARKAVADMPELAAPHVLMGNILLREGNALQARQEYETYLKLEPSGQMAAGARQMIDKIEKATHP
jgi:tetratricopeptide (TPR) repeat protein